MPPESGSRVAPSSSVSKDGTHALMVSFHPRAQMTPCHKEGAGCGTPFPQTMCGLHLWTSAPEPCVLSPGSKS